MVAEFEQEAENFGCSRCLQPYGAGQIEFQTYSQDAPDTLAALTEAREAFGVRRQKGRVVQASTSHLEKQTGKTKTDTLAEGVDFIAVLSEFPNVDLALRLFTTIENGRIDFLLRSIYRGIRRDLDFVRARLIERRPRLEAIPQNLCP